MANEAQAGHGNSAEVSHWVTCQQPSYTMVAPFGDRLIAVAHIASPDRVPDVGRGAAPPR